jgi:energy-coupling factor transporter ATP-binding protein EcfA2
MTKEYKFPTEKHLAELTGDLFGYNDLSKKVLHNILLQMELPNCFGVYGNWGSGKTTFTHFLEQHIQASQQNIAVVRFEPWKYEYADGKDLIFALLKKIESELNKKQIQLHIADLCAGLLTVGTVVAENSSILATTYLATHGIPIKIPMMNFDVKKMKSNFKEYRSLMQTEYNIWVDKIESFRKEFEDTLKKALGKKQLYIIIDDLDRCLPENTVKLLESIKNFLSVENTLFIFALDSGVVAEMIEKKYGLHDGYGQEYLMKIIHYYIDLPKKDNSQIIETILISHGIDLTKTNPLYLQYIILFANKFLNETRRMKHFLHHFCIKYNLLSEHDRNFLMGNRMQSGLGPTSRFCDYFLLQYIKFKLPNSCKLDFLKMIAGKLNSNNFTNDERDRYSNIIELLEFGFRYTGGQNELSTHRLDDAQIEEEIFKLI